MLPRGVRGTKQTLGSLGAVRNEVLQNLEAAGYVSLKFGKTPLTRMRRIPRRTVVSARPQKISVRSREDHVSGVYFRQVRQQIIRIHKVLDDIGGDRQVGLQ